MKLLLLVAGTDGKRQPYLKLTDEQRATIGCYAAEHGTVNVICHFKGDFPKDSLKESTIQIFSRIAIQSRKFSWK